MTNLKNKIALVTGGSRGIGAAIVKRLSAEGAKVAFTYASSGAVSENLVKEIENSGGEAIAIKADSGSYEEVTGAVEKAAAHFGKIDILVNNAGVADGKAFEEYTQGDFNRMFDVNVKGVFFATQAAIKHIPDGGRIITIGSCLAEIVTVPNLTLYSMSKSALVGFNKGLARDLGDRRITANLVNPGPTETDMNPATGPIADAARERMAIKEYGTAEGIASLVAWVAGEESKYMTGTSLTMDSGTNI